MTMEEKRTAYEAKILDLLRQIEAVAREHDPEFEYLSMAIYGDGYIHFNNNHWEKCPELTLDHCVLGGVSDDQG